MKIKIEYWKTTGKYYSTEEMEIDDLDTIETRLLRQMVSTVYLVEKDGYEQPYRCYLL